MSVKFKEKKLKKKRKVDRLFLFSKIWPSRQPMGRFGTILRHPFLSTDTKRFFKDTLDSNIHKFYNNSRVIIVRGESRIFSREADFKKNLKFCRPFFRKTKLVFRALPKHWKVPALVKISPSVIVTKIVNSSIIYTKEDPPKKTQFPPNFSRSAQKVISGFFSFFKICLQCNFLDKVGFILCFRDYLNFIWMAWKKSVSDCTMKIVWLVFFHRLRLWNCMISIFDLWRSTRGSITKHWQFETRTAGYFASTTESSYQFKKIQKYFSRTYAFLTVIEKGKL